MKITAQEEYGLRILIRIAGCRVAGLLSPVVVPHAAELIS